MAKAEFKENLECVQNLNRKYKRKKKACNSLELQAFRITGAEEKIGQINNDYRKLQEQ